MVFFFDKNYIENLLFVWYSDKYYELKDKWYLVFFLKILYYSKID